MNYLLYFLLSFLFILSIITIFTNSKMKVFRFIFGLLLLSSYLLFIYKVIDIKYLFIYEIVLTIYIFILSLFLINKKVIKNLTEYDYFLLEKNYNDLIESSSLLKKRFKETMSLIEEGLIFYENNLKEVILSPKAQTIFNSESNLSLLDHSLNIYKEDRDSYLKELERLTLSIPSYSIKYRIIKDGRPMWVKEKGVLIGKGNNKSVIASIYLLNSKEYSSESNYDLSYLKGEDELLSDINKLYKEKKDFSYLTIELSNIKEINEKHGRMVGSITISEFIKFIKNKYNISDRNIYRYTGIRFSLILDDYKTKIDLLSDLNNKKSSIYSLNVSIPNDNLYIKIKAVLINSMKASDPIKIIKMGINELDNTRNKDFISIGE